MFFIICHFLLDMPKLKYRLENNTWEFEYHLNDTIRFDIIFVDRMEKYLRRNAFFKK